MKLKHESNQVGPVNPHEFDGFDVILQRYGASFGLLAGMGLIESRQPSIIDAQPGDTGPWVYHQGPTHRLVAGIAELLGEIRNAIGRIRSKRQERRVLSRLLRESDHYLRDIGLDRSQLEELMVVGGSLMGLKSSSVSGVAGRAGRLRLVKRSSRELGNEESMEGYDRAA